MKTRQAWQFARRAEATSDGDARECPCLSLLRRLARCKAAPAAAAGVISVAGTAIASVDRVDGAEDDFDNIDYRGFADSFRFRIM